MTDNVNPDTQVVVDPAQPTTVEPVVEVAPQTDPNSLFADQLAGIVADDGRQKYVDVPTALSSIPHAQSHISELTDTVKQLQEELAKREGAEDLLARLQQSTQQSTEQPSVQGLDATAVQDLVSTLLTNKAQEDVATTNGDMVKQSLRQKFGDAAAKEFESVAVALNLDVGQLTQLAKTSPQVVLKLFGDTTVRDPQPTTGSSVNISPTAVNPTTPDYMLKFRHGDTSLKDKWAKAKEAVASQ